MRSLCRLRVVPSFPRGDRRESNLERWESARKDSRRSPRGKEGTTRSLQPLLRRLLVPSFKFSFRHPDKKNISFQKNWKASSTDFYFFCISLMQKFDRASHQIWWLCCELSTKLSMVEISAGVLGLPRSGLSAWGPFTKNGVVQWKVLLIELYSWSETCVSIKCCQSL